MKKHPKKALIPVLVLLLTASCGQDQAGDPASDPGNFSLFTADNEVCILDSRTGLMWGVNSDLLRERL